MRHCSILRPSALLIRAVLPLLGIALAASPVAVQPAAAAEATMFDGDRAQRALEAVEQQAGRKLRVLSIAIKPDALAAEIQDASDPDRVEAWEVSRPSGILGRAGNDVAKRRGAGQPTLLVNRLEQNLFEVRPGDLALVPRLAAAALARARLLEPGGVTQMELRREVRILPEKSLGAPEWHIGIGGKHEQAEIYADLAGKITFADLERTLRAERLDLLAGGADLDELVQQIRDETKKDWAFRYLEVEKKGIAFEATLARSPNSTQVTRFAAGLSGVRTDAMTPPRTGLGLGPPSLPFSLDEADFGVVPKITALAREQGQLPDGKINRITLTKPKREIGASPVEWQVSVEEANAPLFRNPTAPPIREATVVFDPKGKLLRTIFPRGQGPQISLFEPAALTKAMAIVADRLGEHLKVSEIMVRRDSIAITAQDPQNPTAFAVFDYRDEEVQRAADMDARVMIAKSQARPSWLFDIAEPKPAIAQSLAGLEQQTVARFAISKGEVERITFSKDKPFRPANDKVLIEIRISAGGEGQNSQWLTWELSGKPADDTLLQPSGLRVVRSVAKRDVEDCTNSSDSNRIIPACTKLIESGQGAGHDLALVHYNRGVGYEQKHDIDRAIADYGEAIRIDPDYARPYNNRAWLYRKAKHDLDRSLIDLDAAVRIDPEYKLALANRADLYVEKGDWDRAIADYDTAVRLDPNNAELVFNRAAAYFRKGDCSPAIADFTEAIRLEPKAAGAYTLRGRCQRTNRDFDRAIADFSEAIRLTPRDVEPYLDRAAAYSDKGDFDRAVAEYGEALRVDPNSASGYRQRGWVQRRKGALPLAIADYDRAVQLAPKDAALLYERGFARYLAGSPAKALADVSRANALDPKLAYPAIWLELLGRRSQLPSQMARAAAQVNMGEWPAPVIKLLLGELTPEALLAAAEDPDANVRRDRICEANFYLGELALLKGEKPAAGRLFTKAANDCPTHFFEWEAAKAELKSLPPQ